MVKFATSVALLLTAVSSALAAPQPLEARDDTSCMDHLGRDSMANTNEAVECINYLASLGDQACVATVSGVSFCRRGNTQITGLARGLLAHETASSRCQDVARGAGLILDKCSRNDGKVRGQNPAWGNGHLVVDIRNNPQ